MFRATQNIWLKGQSLSAMSPVTNTALVPKVTRRFKSHLFYKNVKVTKKRKVIGNKFRKIKLVRSVVNNRIVINLANNLESNKSKDKVIAGRDGVKHISLEKIATFTDSFPVFDGVEELLEEFKNNFLMELKNQEDIQDEYSANHMLRGVPSREHRNFVICAGYFFRKELVASDCTGLEVFTEGRFIVEDEVIRKSKKVKTDIDEVIRKLEKVKTDIELKPDVMIREFNFEWANVADLDRIKPILIVEYLSEENSIDDLEIMYLRHQKLGVKYLIIVFEERFVVFELSEKGKFILKVDLDFVFHDKCKIQFPSELIKVFEMEKIKNVDDLLKWIVSLVYVKKIIREEDMHRLFKLYNIV